MRYLSWAVFYEGSSDALYLDVLLPRIVRDLILREGANLVEMADSPAVRVGSKDRSIAAVANEACAFSDAFDVLFIHADTGGRGQEQGLGRRADAYCMALQERCNWPTTRCVTITPRHETEAWLLADGEAVTAALGYNGDPQDAGLPANAHDAERLADPKNTLAAAVATISGRRRRPNIETIFPAVAQRQRLDALRQSASFRDLEERIRVCLRSLQLIA